MGVWMVELWLFVTPGGIINAEEEGIVIVAPGMIVPGAKVTRAFFRGLGRPGFHGGAT